MHALKNHKNYSVLTDGCTVYKLIVEYKQIYLILTVEFMHERRPKNFNDLPDKKKK